MSEASELPCRHNAYAEADRVLTGQKCVTCLEAALAAETERAKTAELTWLGEAEEIDDAIAALHEVGVVVGEADSLADCIRRLAARKELP